MIKNSGDKKVRVWWYGRRKRARDKRERDRERDRERYREGWIARFKKREKFQAYQFVV